MSVIRAQTQLTKSLEKLKTEYATIQSIADAKKEVVKAKMEGIVKALEALNVSESNEQARIDNN